MEAKRGYMEISYIAQLVILTRKTDEVWVALCLTLDVMTQASTENKALRSLQEAVHLWLKSCINRGVLEEALKEEDFKKFPLDAPSDITDKANPDYIRVDIEKELPIPFFPPKDDSFFQGTFSAHIANEQLGRYFHEAC